MEESVLYRATDFHFCLEGYTLTTILPDLLDDRLGKYCKLRQKISAATSAIKSVFGQEETQQKMLLTLEKLRERMIKVRELFVTQLSELVIVNLRKLRLEYNIKNFSGDGQGSNTSVGMIQNDPELSSLTMIQAPLVDVEIRGVPAALQFLGTSSGNETSS
ncbi:ATPase ARSA1 [Sesamum angolense]|uniref:ATPase ARSA1 n=1 Tax=Sesamum angolense TaxID=2727404 RepID=A0AAE1W3B1_9LAMI|nr:ATPase ARSA1 [Sesamum angolense]